MTKEIPDHRGYVLVWRKLKDSFIFSDSETLHVWIYILLHANWKEKEILLENKKEIIKRGEFITSQVKISEKTGINRIKVNRILKVLKNEQLIEQQTTNRFTRIKVINYDKYQKTEQQTEQQVNSKRTANEQQVNTTNNNKNYNNYKKKKRGKHSSINDLQEKDFEEIARKYGVKKKFVTEKFDDLNNYCKSKGKRYKNYKRALMNFVKKDMKQEDKVVEKKDDFNVPKISEEQRKKNREMIKRIKNKQPVKSL
jgi:hypothetical protein